MEKRKSILVIDDDEWLLKMLTLALNVEGYDVVVSTDGEAVLDLMADKEPSLIILDIMMPKFDGFQVLALIRQKSNMPVIMLSGRREAIDVRDALALGADDYLRKPFSVYELIARVRAKLRRVRLQPA
jgi:DNA-binding response OmpR family regulator